MYMQPQYGQTEAAPKIHVYATRQPDTNGLVGLVAKASASRAEDPGFESCLRRDFPVVESYQ